MAAPSLEVAVATMVIVWFVAAGGYNMPLAGRTIVTVGGMFSAFVTVIKFERLVTLDPPGPITVKITEKIPALEYVWLGLVSVLTPPSPKVHEWLVIVPIDASVKFTSSGAAPFNGLAVNAATGAPTRLVTVMKFERNNVFDPTGPDTVKLTE